MKVAEEEEGEGEVDVQQIVYIVEEEDEISRVLLPMILELVKKLKVAHSCSEGG